MPDAYSANLRATLNNNFADGDWGEIGAAYPALTAHIDAQAERIAELERDNARLRKGLQSVKIQDTRNEYQTYLNYAEDREYSTKVEVEGPCAKIARAALAKARA